MKASYLGLCAFLDFNNEEKDERLVIFGGQTLSSIAAEASNASLAKGSKIDEDAVNK